MHDANNDGEPDELLILDAASGGKIANAVDVWRWNQAGLGHSGNGYAGPYDSVAITYDGKISATAITTGVLNANLIKAGVIEDVNHNSQIDMTTGIAKLYELIAKRDFAIKDDNDVTKAYISTVIDGTVMLRLLDALGQDKRAQLYVNNYDRGELVLWDENGTARVTAWGDGAIILRDSNGDPTIELDGSVGRVKATNAFDEVYSGTLSNIGAWWTFSTDFAGLLVVGKVVSTGSRTTTIIPIEMLNATPTRFFLSDESNYISFDCSVDNGLAKIEIAGKSSTGFIERVYGMF